MILAKTNKDTEIITGVMIDDSLGALLKLRLLLWGIDFDVTVE